MLAQENPIMAEATDTIRKLTEDEKIRDACYRRDEQLAHEAYIAKELKRMTHEITEKDKELTQKDKELTEKDKEILELRRLLAEATKNSDN